MQASEYCEEKVTQGCAVDKTVYIFIKPAGIRHVATSSGGFLLYKENHRQCRWFQSVEKVQQRLGLFACRWYNKYG